MADNGDFRHSRSHDGYAPAKTAERPDPLAELARLIGQDDPFGKLGREFSRTAPAREPTARVEAPLTAPDPFETDMREPAPRRSATLDPHDYRDHHDYEEPRRRYDESDPFPPEPSLDHWDRRDPYDLPQQADPYAAHTHVDPYEEEDRRYAREQSFDAQDPRYVHDAYYEEDRAAPHASHSHAAYAHETEHYDPRTQVAGTAGFAADPYRGQRADVIPQYAVEAQAAQAYYADESHLPPEGAEAIDVPPPEKRRRGGLLTIGVVLGLALVGTAGALAYRSFSGPSRIGAPPTIKADATPAKVAPDPQTQSQANKVIYDRVGDHGQGERVVSREEQPVDLREAPRPSLSLGVMGQPGPSTRVASTAPTGAVAPATEPAAGPKRVKTVVIRPDQPVATGSTVTPPVAARTPFASAAPAGRPAAVEPGSYLVQLASQKTEADAHASFRALQSRFAGLLANRQPIIRRVDLGERGVFYRAQVGPFASAEQASEFCGSLKAQGGQCLVQRN